MQTTKLAFLLLIILGVLIFTQRKTAQKSVTVTPSFPTPTPSLTPVITQQPSTAGEDKNVMFDKPKNTPSPSPQNNSGSTADFRYPNSSQVGVSGNTTTYESSDNPKTITDWYKDRIKSVGMNTTSFVQTTTNGNVFNSLAGAERGRQVKVEIKKGASESTVKISVTM